MIVEHAFQNNESNKAEDPGFDLKRKRIGYFLLAIVLASSLLNITRWLLLIPSLTGLSPDGSIMKPVTALSFIISSVSVILLNLYNPGKARNVSVIVSALAVFLISGLSFAVHLRYFTTGQESPVAGYPLLKTFLPPEWRMAFVTSILFMVLSIVLALLTFQREKLTGLAHYLIIPLIIISYFVPMSYSIGITAIYIVNEVSVSLLAGVNFIFLGGAILLLYPNTWLMRVFLDRFSGGNMARRLVPGILIVPLLIAWLRLKGEQRGIFSSETGIVLVGVTYTFCFLAIVWLSARRVIKLELQRRTLDDFLRKKEEQHKQEAVFMAKQVEAILSCIPVGVIVYDSEANIIRKNSAAEKILEYPREGFDLSYNERLTTLLEVWDENGYRLKPEEMPAYKAAVEGETTINQVLLFKTRVRASWISVSSAPLMISGKHTGGVISMMNVTDLKKAEEALRHSREELKSITDNSPDVIARFDLSLRHMFINPYGEKVYGKSREQILGRTNDELGMPGDNVAFWNKIFEEVIDSGEQRNAEFEFDSPSLGHLQFHSVFVPERDSSGSLGSILAITRDITRVKEIEEKFRTLFENISEGVAIHEIIYDGDKPVNYRIIDVNPAYKNIIGIDKDQAVGALATELYQTDEPPYFDTYLEVASTQKSHRFEIHIEQLDRYFMIDAVSPRKGQFATVFEDITEQKRTEYEIKTKNEELTRFIYTVSHDLKSPLVTIKSFTAYLREDIANQDKLSWEKDIRYIENAADKMGNLLNELLELSRIGRKEDPKTPVAMKTIAQSAVDLVAGRIISARAKVIITGPEVMLYGHAQRLLQLYQNLLDNAVKFMGQQPEPLVEIGSNTDPGGHIVLYVRDNGSGIDPRYHDKVFGLFEKLDNKTEGTGIGLALIKRIVEIHQGSVWFTSEGEGKGTTFYFTLEKSHIMQ